ncbi:MAG: DUF460 domain-containing protein [Candidatus Bathyarchaeia archaeon]
MRKLITAIDPGITCGAAVLTLDGDLVFVGSKRGWSHQDLLQTILDLGETVVVAGDVSPAPELVEKISKSLNAVLFTPLIPLSASEKQHLARTYAEQHELKLRNKHEVDALAAAIKAHQHYKNKFEQIEAHVKETGVQVPMDEVKAMVVRGYSIKRAVRFLLPKPKGAEPKPVMKPRTPHEEQLRNLVKRLKARVLQERERSERFKTLNEELRLQIKALNQEISTLRQKIEETKSEQMTRIQREREYQRLLDEINVLKRRLSSTLSQLEEYKQRFDTLKHVRELESKGELILLKPIETFTKEGLENAFKLYEIKPKDSVILLDASGGGATTAEMLAKRGVRIIVTRTSMAHHARETFTKHEIPIVPADKIEIEWIEGYPYAKASNLQKAVEELRKAEKDKTLEKLETILKDYRKEREGRMP